MARLTSLAVGGYYPFPPAHLDALTSLFNPATRGRLLDPCAGEGTVLDHLARGWHLTPFANELDTQRAAACEQKFGLQAVQGDLFHLRASSQGFVGVWCNPPYAHEADDSDARRELKMLKHSWKWVQAGGYMLWCIYAHHLTETAALFLAKNSAKVDVWFLPGLHLHTYTQLVVVAQVGEPTHEPLEAMKAILAQKDTPLELTVQSTPRYTFPTPRQHTNFIFAPTVMTPERVLQAVERSGAFQLTGFQTLLTPTPPVTLPQPIVQPRLGQLALVLAAGLLNGAVLNTPQGEAAVRSTVVSVQTHVETIEVYKGRDPDPTAQEHYLQQPIPQITLLTAQGDVHDLSGDAALVEFIHTHQTALLAYLNLHYQPLYTFQMSEPTARLLQQLRVQGSPLYPAQQQMIAAGVQGLHHKRAVYLVGEPGVGKTALAGGIALCLQENLRAGEVHVVICPPQLTPKWEREMVGLAKSLQRPYSIQVVESVEDTKAFMDKAATLPTTTFQLLIISRERAKLGEGWAPAVKWLNKPVAFARDEQGQVKIDPLTGKKQVLHQCIAYCPTCHEAIMHHAHTPEARYVDAAWLAQAPRQCPCCGEALWQYIRRWSGPDPGQKFPKRNPRVPLASYLVERFADRLGLVVFDELHEAKSQGTDQGRAMLALSQKARWCLGLTGTLYGGRASTLYGLEFAFNPRVRHDFPWRGGLPQWVKQMGVLEQVIEQRPQYNRAGVLTGYNRYVQPVKEGAGCSPFLVGTILDHSVFVGLKDLGKVMPSYVETPVSISLDQDMQTLYKTGQTVMGKYLFEQRLQGDVSFQATYLQALLSWINAPFREEPAHHKKYDTRVWTFPALARERLYPKETWLIERVKAELAEGRRVLIYLRQTGEKDIQPRIVDILKEHVPTAKPYILPSSIEPKKREQRLQAEVGRGVNVLICNPLLVQTGLDLCAFPTIVFFEISYSLYVTLQASRRAWRVIQDQPCRTFYPYYAGTMEAQAISLMAKKQRAAEVLYGQIEGGGLSDLVSEASDDLLRALMKWVQSDAPAMDSPIMFAQQDTPVYASPWDVLPVLSEPLPTPTLIPATVELVQPVPETSCPVETKRIPFPTLNPSSRQPQALPPKPSQPRRRKVQLSDAPADAVLPVTIPKPATAKADSGTVQLALF